MIISSDVEIPDNCPPDCALRGFDPTGNGWCEHCPIWLCKPPIEPIAYRKAWAIEWKKFFETGEEPVLRLEKL